MKLIIAANWKMNKTRAETEAFCREIKARQEDFHDTEVVICPPFTSLEAAGRSLSGSAIKLGAQNLFWEKAGAFTGEVAPPMLVDLGVQYVIIGHSERRHLLGEDDAAVHKKLKAALEHRLRPILCVGETREERERGETEVVVGTQLRRALEGLDPALIEELVVAYEPVWAIGTGIAATAADAHRAATLVREIAAECLGSAAAERLRVQYGGSVNAGNIGEFVALPSIDGALVGGASLAVDSFAALILSAQEAAR
ncbi:MAG: triose-phosphate isomerase [Firmicutes bacterium]|nr:triose-phosphate isomerase [Bacillota bacterium]